LEQSQSRGDLQASQQASISGREHSRVANEGSHSVRLDSWDIVPEDEIPQSCPTGDSPLADNPSESDLTQSQKTATSENSDLDSLQAVTEVAGDDGSSV